MTPGVRFRPENDKSFFKAEGTGPVCDRTYSDMRKANPWAAGVPGGYTGYAEMGGTGETGLILNIL